MITETGFAKKCTWSAIASLVVFTLYGCETPRWSKQWASFPQIKVPTDSISTNVLTQTVTVQVYGVNGYRFGTAGASVLAELPATSIGWDSSIYRVVSVRLAGASDGLDEVAAAIGGGRPTQRQHHEKRGAHHYSSHGRGRRNRQRAWHLPTG